MSDDMEKKTLAGLSNLYSREQIVNDQLLEPPKESGFNFWFFEEIPGNTPPEGCFKKDGRTLLYVGISENLYNRILNHHCRGTAAISTLRKSLGVLLAQESGYTLQKVGGKGKTAFSPAGEDWLNDWMDKNAFVCWYEHKTPWEIKREVIEIFSPPLNIQDGTHPFGEILRKQRNEAEQMAQKMSVVHE